MPNFDDELKKLAQIDGIGLRVDLCREKLEKFKTEATTKL